MVSPNIDVIIRNVEAEIAAARAERLEIFEKEMEVDTAIRELEARYLGDLYAESREALLKRQRAEEKIEALERELSILKSQ